MAAFWTGVLLLPSNLIKYAQMSLFASKLVMNFLFFVSELLLYNKSSPIGISYSIALAKI